MMFIRGKAGILEEIERVRSFAAIRQSGPGQAKLMRDRVLALGEVYACNQLLSIIGGATLMSEADYDKAFGEGKPISGMLKVEAEAAS